MDDQPTQNWLVRIVGPMIGILAIVFGVPGFSQDIQILLLIVLGLITAILVFFGMRTEPRNLELLYYGAATFIGVVVLIFIILLNDTGDPTTPELVQANYGLVTLSAGTECIADRKGNEIEFLPADVPDLWQQCHFQLRPNRPIVPEPDSNQSPLGIIQAEISYVEPEITPPKSEFVGASAYVEMVTFVDGIGLQIHCGIYEREGELSGYFSVAMVAPPDQLVCSETLDDQDAQDGRCDIAFDNDIVSDLQPNKPYTVRLEALQNSPSVFSCTVNGVSREDYTVKIEDTNYPRENLLGLQFQRWIEVTLTGGHTGGFIMSDVMETP